MTLEQFAERYPTLQYGHLKIVERCIESCKDEEARGRYLDMLDGQQGTAEGAAHLGKTQVRGFSEDSATVKGAKMMGLVD